MAKPPRLDSPCYAVIFSAKLSDDSEGYVDMAARMEAAAARQPGFLGLETSRGADGFGITVSYWDSLEAIDRWRGHPEHRLAQQLGRTRWYEHYDIRIARVDRSFGGTD